MRRPLLALLLLAATSGSRTLAQKTTPPACDAPEHRQFDFWIGHWKVMNPAGQVVGENTVSGILGGCALREDWVGARGMVGTSINFYDRTTGRWHQTWIGSDGQALFLAGGLDTDGRMVLEQRGEERIDRITWTPLPDRAVRQLWEVSTDGGAIWSVVFDGLYTRKP